MATALAVISVVSAVVGAVKQNKIAKAQRKQNKIANKVAAITRRRGVKRQIAASRVRAAQAQAAGFSLGVGGSTAVQGAVAGVRSDTASTVGFSNLQSAGQGHIADLQNNISLLQQQQATVGAIGSIAGTLAGNPKAVAGIENFFGVG